MLRYLLPTLLCLTLIPPTVAPIQQPSAVATVQAKPIGIGKLSRQLANYRSARAQEESTRVLLIAQGTELQTEDLTAWRIDVLCYSMLNLQGAGSGPGKGEFGDPLTTGMRELLTRWDEKDKHWKRGQWSASMAEEALATFTVMEAYILSRRGIYKRHAKAMLASLLTRLAQIAEDDREKLALSRDATIALLWTVQACGLAEGIGFPTKGIHDTLYEAFRCATSEEDAIVRHIAGIRAECIYPGISWRVFTQMPSSKLYLRLELVEQELAIREGQGKTITELELALAFATLEIVQTDEHRRLFPPQEILSVKDECLMLFQRLDSVRLNSLMEVR